MASLLWGNYIMLEVIPVMEEGSSAIPPTFESINVRGNFE
jgi:hypothetical protein